MEHSPRLGLPFIQPSQAQKHVTHNEALTTLDCLAQLTVVLFEAEAPPSAPDEGACYALGAAPIGAWHGHTGQLAVWDGVAWWFYAPQEGWRAWGEGRLRVFDGANWVVVPASVDTVAQLGVATDADSTNKLAVASEASLFSHAGAGHQMKINKAADTETASLLFQSAWSGHAELGLVGDTALSVKVSAEGSNWTEAVRIDPVADAVTWSTSSGAQVVLSDAQLQVDVPLAGAAVQAAPLDETEECLMRVGAFGLGASDSAQVRVGDGEIHLPSGFYSGSGSSADAATFPSSGCRYRPFINATRRVTTGAFEQLRLFFDNNTMYLRTANTGGEWSTPLPLYSSANVVGPVSQSGGVPTGAVIETGETSNGHYVRFADGTQICWNSLDFIDVATAIGAGFRSADQSWVFPAAFATAPGPIFGQAAHADVWMSGAGGSATSASCRLQAFAAVSGSVSAQVGVIGRWM